MNILATSNDAQICARNLDNWSLEEQLLTVALLMTSYADWCSYPVSNIRATIAYNHPFMRWLFNDEPNIDWLKEYGIMLLIEYGQRQNVRHAGANIIYNFVEDFRPPIGMLPKAFMNRAWDANFDFRFNQNPHDAYKSLLFARWNASVKKISWGFRGPPMWYIEQSLKRAGEDLNDLARKNQQAA